MADTYVSPYTSYTTTKGKGTVPSTQVSQQAQTDLSGRVKRGENVLTPVPGDYSVVPAPQQGAGRWGLVPGPVGMPDPYGNLSKVYPNLGPTQDQLSQDIMSRLQGQLSPDTIANIENAAATFGVQSGMPGSGVANAIAPRDIGLMSQQLQQQGIGDFASILPMLSSTETVSPALQTQIAERNAQMAATPNPQLAGQYAKHLFDEYMKNLTGQGGQGMFGLSPETSQQIGQYAQLAGTVLSLLA